MIAQGLKRTLELLSSSVQTFHSFPSSFTPTLFPSSTRSTSHLICDLIPQEPSRASLFASNCIASPTYFSSCLFSSIDFRWILSWDVLLSYSDLELFNCIPPRLPASFPMSNTHWAIPGVPRVVRREGLRLHSVLQILSAPYPLPHSKRPR
jgi:hypothetical protein